MIGISLRLALTLRLHLRNEDPALEESNNDTLVHTWWSIHSIECLLGSITRLPPTISSEYCTMPLPRSSPNRYQKLSDKSRRTSYGCTKDGSPLAWNSSNKSWFGKRLPTTEHYHISRINISLIAEEALLHLYSPRTATQSCKVRPSIFTTPGITCNFFTNATNR